ncbi:PEP-CTERM sorting domain-containing protein [Desulfobacter postgatei]|jgi:hypothetical protein|uniref:PEP-CTERM sorting domain-containing protein n=1 Tax=Desulfobacter postgatei TaxID=2293 RepID=UPI00387E11E1
MWTNGSADTSTVGIKFFRNLKGTADDITGAVSTRRIFDTGWWNNREPTPIPEADNIVYAVWSLGSTDQIDPAPEPATFLLFGLGILGIAGVSRKKTA